MANKLKAQRAYRPEAGFSLLRGKIEICLTFLVMAMILLPYPGFCDLLRLKEAAKAQEGNEVEILEEREDSFIIKVPKEEIEVIIRKRPTEIKLWKEKRILWEDTGDYLAFYLPKEKIALPQGYTGKEYTQSKVMEEKLRSALEEGGPAELSFLKVKGKISGRILKKGKPLPGAKVKLVYVSSGGEFSRLFGPKELSPQESVFETTANEEGFYEFKNIPIGDYDIYWAAPGAQTWFRRLSEKPNITVRAQETVSYPDIEI